ncbi:hypothetical protein Cob_v006950 [Colletotrichum orbiculare MAFF 240422]|uniref:Uncharacterized protein n=1 Tax=Colletotrichum orbiculare (strain 104-T / ATCC 96160 / CBS 514.97 / LARS 414 / MAFF 240422) TaxID=1213857 RepID=A0A484FQL0_COLOR|nr:hypothetical protein Cob_v006950 [Colletotrichum orbiculare MAFF 240422]
MSDVSSAVDKRERSQQQLPGHITRAPRGFGTWLAIWNEPIKRSNWRRRWVISDFDMMFLRIATSGLLTPTCQVGLTMGGVHGHFCEWVMVHNSRASRTSSYPPQHQRENWKFRPGNAWAIFARTDTGYLYECSAAVKPPKSSKRHPTVDPGTKRATDRWLRVHSRVRAGTTPTRCALCTPYAMYSCWEYSNMQQLHSTAGHWNGSVAGLSLQVMR